MDDKRLLMMIGGGYGAEQTLTLQSPAITTTDTYINSAAPTDALYAGAIYALGEPNDAVQVGRMLIKFDLTSLPTSALISSATLSLYCTSDKATNARTWRIFRLKRNWVESQATWNSYSTGNAWQTAGAFGELDCEQTDIGTRDFTASETTGEFKDFTLTPTTKTGLDLGYGWMIKVDTEENDGYRFSSSKNLAEADRPKLVIVYRARK